MKNFLGLLLKTVIVFVVVSVGFQVVMHALGDLGFRAIDNPRQIVNLSMLVALIVSIFYFVRKRRSADRGSGSL